jgi:hypothetical protein
MDVRGRREDDCLKQSVLIPVQVTGADPGWSVKKTGENLGIFTVRIGGIMSSHQCEGDGRFPSPAVCN